MYISSLRSLSALFFLPLPLLLAACGRGPAVFCQLPSNSSSCCGSCPVSPGLEFLYATSISNGGEITIFPIDHDTGLLGISTATSGPAMASGITSAQHQFLYVSDTQGGAIDAFSIDQTSGTLTIVPGSPFSPSGQLSFSPLALAVDTELYATSITGITGFTIGSDGALTTIVGSPYSGGFSGQAALGQSNTTPINYFLYATNFIDPNGTISVFRIVDPASGILTPVPGTFTTGAFSGPDGIVFNSASSPPLVFVALNSVNKIAAFSVDVTTGALTLVPGSPFAAGFEPVFLALNSAQNVLYAMNFSGGSISAYNIASNGVLTPVSGSPFTVGLQPGSIAITGDNYFYVSLPASDIIEGFSINPIDGGLTPLAGSPFPATAAAFLSVVQIPPP